MRRQIVVGVAATLLSVVGMAGIATADTSVSIGQVESTPGELQFVAALSDVPADTEVSEDSVEATIDGTSVQASIEALSESDEITQTALLVMDTSDSMRGTKLEDAKAAAESFINQIPTTVAAGLMTFSSAVELEVPPTLDRGELTAAVQGLTTSPQTRLYDAVVVASRQISQSDVGSVLLLSDGADRGSTASLDQAVAAARRSDSRFDIVSFGTSTAQVDALNDIADASGGTVTEATGAAELANAFTAAASTIDNSYLVTAALPEDFASPSATVGVSIEVGDAVVTDTAVVTIERSQQAAVDQATKPVPAPELGPLARLSDNLIWIAVGAVAIALLVLVYVAMSATSQREASGSRGVRRRLSIYTLGGGQPVKEQETTVLGDTQVARSAVEFADRVVAKRDFESDLGTKLDAAAVPLKPAEWLLIHVGITIAAGLFFLLLFGGRLFPTILGMIVGFLLPLGYLTLKESRRKKAFMAALPDTLQLMAGSLSAGYSMPQAVDTVVREGSPPISTEFNRALVETRLGVELEDALDGVAERMESVDFAWVVMAIRIQREVGGNLAEVLNTVSATLRERERLRRQVQVLSAEGRLSAWILGLLPVVFALYLVLAQPDYLLPMVQSALGWLMIGAGLILLLVGALWLRKVVKVEV